MVGGFSALSERKEKTEHEDSYSSGYQVVRESLRLKTDN